jgi:hypothetical protein
MFRNMTTAQLLTLAFNLLFGVTLVAGAFGFADFHPDPEVTEIAGIIIAILNVIRHYQGTQAVQVAQAEAAEARAQ